MPPLAGCLNDLNQTGTGNQHCHDPHKRLEEGITPHRAHHAHGHQLSGNQENSDAASNADAIQYDSQCLLPDESRQDQEY